ncbi:MAG: PCRF domain-containing protein, partial [Bacteroidales bacterium]|nr:PCRF domain-containing protein [Bacteroidales bacterium]
MAENLILEKLEGVKQRFEEVAAQVNSPDAMQDMKRYVALNKEFKDLEPLIQAYNEYKTILGNIEEAREILKNEQDEEMREMAKEEFETLSASLPEREEQIKIMLLPKDPEDDKNAIIEIRGGTGGDEAAIFAGDLYRMYTKYCEKRRWKIEITRFTEGTMGGYKEIVFTVSSANEGVYGIMKYESGVHRVQRVPQTET